MTIERVKRVLLMVVWGAALVWLIRVLKTKPYFPGDVILARVIQAIFPYGWWVKAFAHSAEPPASVILLAATAFFAYLLGGVHAAAFSVPVFFGLFFFYVWASHYVAQPRPSPELIHVWDHPGGFAFPSIFALVYVATFGYIAVLAGILLKRPWRNVVLWAIGVWLSLGAIARVVAGAHWPSDLVLSYLVGFFWIFLLRPLITFRGEGTYWPSPYLPSVRTGEGDGAQGER